MKNVLFATTALVAFGGAAFAGGHASISDNLTLKGGAEIGLYMTDTDGAAAPADGTVRFHHDMDMDITFKRTNDAGLTFGADIDLDEVSGGISNNAGPHTVFISGGFGTLTMGDTDGAYDKNLQEIAVGSTITDDPEHAGYDGNSGLDGLNDGQVARYDYDFGAANFSISGELDDAGTGDSVLGVGVSGDFGGFGVGVGYQASGDNSIVGATLDGSFAGLGFVVNVASAELDLGGGATDDRTHYGLSLEYTTGALTVGANYAVQDSDVLETEGFGAWVTYDLGGGASVVAGLAQSEAASVETTQASFGLSLSF
ncbi:MAG: porin [Pseudomonadota bacterium]